LISLILDDYYLVTPPARAVRNRLANLVGRLRGLAGRPGCLTISSQAWLHG